MKSWLPIAMLALVLPALAPAASAATSEAAPNVCTYDIIESVAVCVTRDSAGRTCVIVYVGPSTPVYRCANPSNLVDAVNPCVRTVLVDAGACVSASRDEVCVDGHWGHYPFGECVYVGPDAQAASAVDPICKVGDADCSGYLVCVWETRYTTDVCVRDPCDDTACWRAEGVARCVVIVPEGGDMGEKVCWDLQAECKVWYQRTTFIGTWTICLVPPGRDGGASAERAPYPCMDRYWETSAGPVRVVSRSSCEYQVYYNDQPILA